MEIMASLVLNRPYLWRFLPGQMSADASCCKMLNQFTRTCHPLGTSISSISQPPRCFQHLLIKTANSQNCTLLIYSTLRQGKFICIDPFNNKAGRSALHKVLKQHIKGTQGNLKRYNRI